MNKLGKVEISAPFIRYTAQISRRMAPNISEEEIDDLIYLARVGEKDELAELLSSLSTRENVSTAEILTAAKDEGKNTCLHMAAGNGHLGIPPVAHVPSTPRTLTNPSQKPSPS